MNNNVYNVIESMLDIEVEDIERSIDDGIVHFTVPLQEGNVVFYLVDYDRKKRLYYFNEFEEMDGCFKLKYGGKPISSDGKVNQITLEELRISTLLGNSVVTIYEEWEEFFSKFYLYYLSDIIMSPSGNFYSTDDVVIELFTLTI